MMDAILRNMQEKLHEIMSDSDDETTSDRDTVAAVHGSVRCHWAGFRHGMIMIQWRRWHWILGTSVVDNRRRGQVAESQMIMAVMWKRKLLGKRWQVIKARMQDKHKVEDNVMQCTGMAAGRALKLAQKRRKSEEETHEGEQGEHGEATGVASILGHHEEKKNSHEGPMGDDDGAGGKNVLDGCDSKKHARETP